MRERERERERGGFGRGDREKLTNAYIRIHRNKCQRSGIKFLIDNMFYINVSRPRP